MSNKLLQDNEGNTSSKRVFGSVGIGAFFFLTCGIAVLSVYTANDIGDNAKDLLIAMGGFSASLLGVGVVEKFAKKEEVKK